MEKDIQCQPQPPWAHGMCTHPHEHIHIPFTHIHKEIPAQELKEREVLLWKKLRHTTEHEYWFLEDELHFSALIIVICRILVIFVMFGWF